jgi:hypothetical protein
MALHGCPLDDTPGKPKNRRIQKKFLSNRAAKRYISGYGFILLRIHS